MGTLTMIKDNNPKSIIDVSAIFRCRDDLHLNVKVPRVNKLPKEEHTANGNDVIDNSNILFSNLWEDGLHIFDGDVRKFSGNISRSIKYC